MFAGRDQGQTLGHLAVLHGLDAGLLQLIRKSNQLGDLVEFATLSERSGPGKDRSDGIRGGLLAL